jgi:hypothetical protein
VFTRTGTTWSQKAKLIPILKWSSGHFGESVSIASEASHAIVGMKNASPDNINSAGMVFFFDDV